MKINDVITYLDDRFHPEYQEDYDNAGFLVGSGDSECKGVLVALDLTDEVIAEARELGYNLIVTHHPMIYHGLKSITDRTAKGRQVMELVCGGMAVYAAHTNLDNMGADGVSGILCDKLGIRNARVLRPTPSDTAIGGGMVGDLEVEADAATFMQKVKRCLGLPWIRCNMQLPTPDIQTVRRIAVCGGSGSFMIEDALSAGADVYLTADLKYHDFERADGRMLLADIGHYESEQFAREIIYRAISEKFSNFACRISEHQHGVVCYM